jgi:hypothetical protein
MTREQAESILRKARSINPVAGGCYCVYQDVADALSAAPDIPCPNPDFARSDVDFEGEPVYVYLKPGTWAHYGKPLPQFEDANYIDR